MSPWFVFSGYNISKFGAFPDQNMPKLHLKSKWYLHVLSHQSFVAKHVWTLDLGGLATHKSLHGGFKTYQNIVLNEQVWYVHVYYTCISAE